jgi:hypothetical protein
MDIAYYIVAVLTALWVGFSGYSLFAKKQFVVESLEQYWLALAKSAGALGLLAGFAVPVLGVAAAAGLIVYFLGATATALRARSYKTAVFPLLYLAPVVATLVLQLAR